MSDRKNILFFYKYPSPFVKKDLEILKNDFNILVHDFYIANKIYTPLSFISQTIFLLRNIGHADLMIGQFAGYHSFLPALFGKIFNKPFLIVVGGTDAHYFPGIGYGNWQKKGLRLFTMLTFRFCSYIAPKHHTLMFSEYDYDITEPGKQGIYARMPNLQKPFTEITNGYDSEKWKCVINKRKKTFITISGAWEYAFQPQLKGIDLILEVAPFFPDCEFAILGVTDSKIFTLAPPNVKILPPTSNEQLIRILSEYEFYLQLSMAEGFPNSLCEAMLCQCIPIGSNVFSIPEIIGNSGFILKHRNVNELKEVVRQAISCDDMILRELATKRIADNYTYILRKEKLLKLCHELIGSKTS